MNLKMLKIKLSEMLLDIKFGKIQTDLGELMFEGDEIAEGIMLYMPDGTAVPDGVYVYEDKAIHTVNGMVTLIEEKDAKPEEEEIEVEETLAEEEVVEEVVKEVTEEPATIDYEKQIAELNERIDAIYSAIENINNTIGEMSNAITSCNEQLSKLSASVKLSVAEPIEKSNIKTTEVEMKGAAKYASFLK